MKLILLLLRSLSALLGFLPVSDWQRRTQAVLNAAGTTVATGMMLTGQGLSIQAVDKTTEEIEKQIHCYNARRATLANPPRT